MVLSNNRRAAGVRFPAASDFRGVQEGGAISPFRDEGVPIPGVRPNCPRPKSPALARKLFEALFDNLCEIASRLEISCKRNGVLGGGISTSSGFDMTRGVAPNVPQVISSLTAAGPSSAGVGEGTFGTSLKPPLDGDVGRSAANISRSRQRRNKPYLQGAPAIAASILLLVGLGGAEAPRDTVLECSCSGRRVLPYLMTLGSGFSSPSFGGGWYGDWSASGANISELRAWVTDDEYLHCSRAVDWILP